MINSLEERRAGRHAFLIPEDGGMERLEFYAFLF